MEKLRCYTVDGLKLQIPLHYDEQSKKYIEDYREYIENTVFTPLGNKVIFAGEDACAYAKDLLQEKCISCESCFYFKRADEHTWIGVCEHPMIKQNS